MREQINTHYANKIQRNEKIGNEIGVFIIYEIDLEGMTN